MRAEVAFDPAEQFDDALSRAIHQQPRSGVLPLPVVGHALTPEIRVKQKF